MRLIKTLAVSALSLFLIWGVVRAGEINNLSGTDASNTNSSYGFPESMAPSAVNDNLRALEGILARWRADTDGSLAAGGGGSSAYTITPNRTISALVDGLVFAFEATSANTSTASLNVSGLGAKEIKKKGGSANLEANDIRAGQKVIVVYDSSSATFQMLSALGNAAAGDLVSTNNLSDVASTAAAFNNLAVGTTQGNILYYDGATWQKLAPGTANQVLTTGGANANPSWGGGGKVTPYITTHSSDTALATQASGGTQIGSTLSSKTIPTAGVIRVTVLEMEIDETEGSANAEAGFAIKVGTGALVWATADTAPGSQEYFSVLADTSVTSVLIGSGIGAEDATGFIKVPLIMTFDIVGKSLQTGTKDIAIFMGDNVNSTTGEITVTGTTVTARILVEIIDAT